MIIETKAITLKKISSFDKYLVPNFIFFNKGSFLINKKKYLNEIKNKFRNDIIIRSSALNEDTKKESKAGFYDS